MGRKRIVFVALCGVALVGVCATRGRVSRHTDSPATANGPGPATLRYWESAGQTFRRTGRGLSQLRAHAADYNAGKITTDEQLRGFWEQWAVLYDTEADNARAAIESLGQLPTEGVDPAAQELVAKAVGYLECRATLNRNNALDCREYAAFYADVIAAGAIPEDAAKVRQLADREERLMAQMTQRIATEGREEKAKLAAVLAVAATVRAELTARNGLDFPDFNTQPWSGQPP